MRRFLLFSSFALLLLELNAQQNNPYFAVSNIKEGLKENADAVIRLHQRHFTIKTVDQAVVKERKVVTIFNKDADNQAFVAQWYDKLTKIVDFDASVYDADGKFIKKLKKNDITDQSYISGFSLYEDNRIRAADLSQKSYPYTVDFSVQISAKFLYSINDWEVLRYENVAVEKSIFQVSAPADLKPKFKLINVPQGVNETFDQEQGLYTYKWVFENLPAQELELYANNEFVDNPKILASPTKFRYEGYEGNLSTWQDVARWQSTLNEGRNDLSDAAKQEARQLVAGVQDDEEKIKLIYEFMQNRTRYVSIQLGIGGLQPFPASVVENKGYGDCKALSFYTQSLLKEVGIEAYYTWIYAGSNPPPLYEDFPKDYGNHIILCVPNKGDTLWLECTSQTLPMGFLGSGTSDRDVIVMTPEGGKIVHTPIYAGKTNRYTTTGRVVIDKEGNATSEIAINFRGGATSNSGALGVIYQNEEVKKEWLRNMIDVPSYELNTYQFEATKARIPEVDLNLKMDIRKVASVSGSRLLLQPNLLNARSYVPKSIERKTPIHYDLSRLVQDTLHYELPEGSFIEQLPEKIEISSDFGDYTAEFVKSEGELTYIRSMQYHQGIYPPEKYEDLIKFYKSVRRADRKKVIISVKT